MDDSSIFGGIHRPAIAVALCPHCGDPCELMGRCPSCNRLLGAICADSLIDREAHLWRVRMVIRHAKENATLGLAARARIRAAT